jgi:hypothetical protein
MVVVARLITGGVVVDVAEMPAMLSWSLSVLGFVTALMRAVVIEVYTLSVEDTLGVVVADTVYDTVIPVDVLSSLSSFSRPFRPAITALALALAPSWRSSRRLRVVVSLTSVTTMLLSTRVNAPPTGSPALMDFEMAVLKAVSALSGAPFHEE